MLVVYEGEAVGLLQEIRWAAELQLASVIFWLDSKVVVDNILHPKEDLSKYETIIQKCRELLSSKFQNFSVF